MFKKRLKETCLVVLGIVGFFVFMFLWVKFWEWVGIWSILQNAGDLFKKYNTQILYLILIGIVLSLFYQLVKFINWLIVEPFIQWRKSRKFV